MTMLERSTEIQVAQNGFIVICHTWGSDTRVVARASSTLIAERLDGALALARDFLEPAIANEVEGEPL